MNKDEKHSVIYQLAAKKLSDEITAEELKQLNELLEHSDENKKIYSELEKIWSQSQPHIKVDEEAAWQNISNRIEDEETPILEISTSKSWRWMSVAASILLVFGIFFLYQMQNVETIEYMASSNVNINLSDGTKVDVKSGSVLSYPDQFSNTMREVNLKGQAFFDVARDKSKPFVIHTSTVDVKVLGTSFYVSTMENGDVEVLVKSGTVKVKDIANDTNEVILNAGENILFKKAKHAFTALKIEANKLYWQTKTLIFKRTTLNEVVKILNMNYDKQVVIANQEMENCKLTATFKDKSFDEILEVIKATFNASVTEEGDKILIDGASCK